MTFGNDGYFRSKAMDYRKAADIKALVLPPNVESLPRADLYPVPPVADEGEFYHPGSLDQVPSPQKLLGVNRGMGIELRTDDDRMWLVVNGSQEEVMPLVAKFLEATNLDIEFMDPESGEIQTAWFRRTPQKDSETLWGGVVKFMNEDENESARDKFRIELKPAKTRGRTLILVGMVSYDKNDGKLPSVERIDWSESEDETPSMAKSMLAELMEFLSEEDASGARTSSSLSQNLTALPRYTMAWDGNGYPILVIQTNFNQAWLEVGQSLRSADKVLNLSDLNRTKAVFYITLVEGVSKVSDNVYEIKLNRAENGIQVAVQIDDETLASKEVSTRVLDTLKEKLD